MSAELAQATKDAGVTRIVFVRHANANPPAGMKKSEYKGIHDWQKADQMRALTDKGKQQAKAARESWFNNDVVYKNNKCLVTSGARRAAETLQLFGEQVKEMKKGGFFASLGCTSADTVAFEVVMEMCGSLHPAGIAPKCEELFDKHGYAPLTKFYAMEGGKEAYAEYGEIVCKEMTGVVNKVKHNAGNTITFFGHAVFLNAIAMQVLTAWGGDATQVAALTDLDLGEAEGILLERGASGATVKHLTLRPHPLWS